MAVNNSVRSITLLANVDLSANQYRFVNINTTGKSIAMTSAGERMVGVQQDKAGQQTGAALEESAIGIDGVSLIILGATVTAGIEVKSDDEGRAVSAATPALGHYVGGILLTGGVEGDVVSMLIRNYEQATT